MARKKKKTGAGTGWAVVVLGVLVTALGTQMTRSRVRRSWVGQGW